MTESYPTIAVHIGHGKTGTSSIQRTLAENEAEIERQGVRHLGYMLENCVETDRVPKVPVGLDMFAGPDPEGYAEMLADVLLREAEEGARQGIRRLIWSNESILARHGIVIPALLRLRDRGVPIEAQCYLRRHDAWAQSAYFQWGIKHKPYPGPVVPFREWAGRRRIVFEPRIRPWLAALGEDFRLFNYDSKGDVVRHFLGINGLALERTAKANEARSPEELLIWSAFNSSFEGPMLPDALQALLGSLKQRPGQLPSLPAPGGLFPTESDLSEVVQRAGRDIERLNALFAARGEPGFDFAPPVRTVAGVDQAVLADTLFRLFLIAYREASGAVEPSERVIAPADGGASWGELRSLAALRAQAEDERRKAEALEARVRALGAELVEARSRPFLNAWHWACDLVARVLPRHERLLLAMRRKRSRHDPGRGPGRA